MGNNTTGPKSCTLRSRHNAYTLGAVSLSCATRTSLRLRRLILARGTLLPAPLALFKHMESNCILPLIYPFREFILSTVSIWPIFSRLKADIPLAEQRLRFLCRARSILTCSVVSCSIPGCRASAFNAVHRKHTSLVLEGLPHSMQRVRSSLRLRRCEVDAILRQVSQNLKGSRANLLHCHVPLRFAQRVLSAPLCKIL
jgi:hypothetical protein